MDNIQISKPCIKVCQFLKFTVSIISLPPASNIHNKAKTRWLQHTLLLYTAPVYSPIVYHKMDKSINTMPSCTRCNQPWYTIKIMSKSGLSHHSTCLYLVSFPSTSISSSKGQRALSTNDNNSPLLYTKAKDISSPGEIIGKPFFYSRKYNWYQAKTCSERKSPQRNINSNS